MIWHGSTGIVKCHHSDRAGNCVPLANNPPGLRGGKQAGLRKGTAQGQACSAQPILPKFLSLPGVQTHMNPRGARSVLGQGKPQDLCRLCPSLISEESHKGASQQNLAHGQELPPRRCHSPAQGEGAEPQAGPGCAGDALRHRSTQPTTRGWKRAWFPRDEADEEITLSCQGKAFSSPGVSDHSEQHGRRALNAGMLALCPPWGTGSGSSHLLEAQPCSGLCLTQTQQFLQGWSSQQRPGLPWAGGHGAPEPALHPPPWHQGHSESSELEEEFPFPSQNLSLRESSCPVLSPARP